MIESVPDGDVDDAPLGAEADLGVVADCATAAEGLKALAKTDIDLVLLDVDLGNKRGLDFLHSARAQ